ncbi:MAG: sugar phosphate isomerase/epimerase family protein [Athalassotoga sp.]|uniref:sugar phosphate isomerase/epimerase family protein n=1 Tax=Athalassotoga sp. TaxID=2022597 RepID=UPI003CFE36BA
MKKGINCWTFPANYTVKECIENAKKAGYDGIEINMEEEKKDTPSLRIDSTKDEIEEIFKISRSNNIPISSVATALHWKYPLTDNDKGVRNKGIKIVEKMIEAAKALHTDAILVVPGVVNEDVSYSKAYKRSQEALKALSKKAEEVKVCIGIENVWNKFLLSPLEMRKFIDEIGSPYVRFYFDVGNVLAFSYPEHWIEVLGDYIVRVHIKDFDTSIGNIQGFKNLFEGDVNWKAVIKALRKVNYDGYLTAELSPYKTHPEMLAYDTSKKLDILNRM